MYSQLKKIISTRFRVPVQTITPASSYKEIGLDLVDLARLSVVIEHELGIQVTDDELAGAATLNHTAMLLLCRDAGVL